MEVDVQGGLVFCLFLDQLGLELSHCFGRKPYRVLRENSRELCVCVRVCARVCVEWVEVTMGYGNIQQLTFPKQNSMHPSGSCCSIWGM